MAQAGPQTRIRRTVLDEIIEHALEETPLECCGLLLGRDDEIEESHRAGNLRQSAVQFEVDPADHFAAIRRARGCGLAVLGAYHSHPRSAARPSASDLRESHDPELLHVIVSLNVVPPAVAAYRIESGRFSEVTLVAV